MEELPLEFGVAAGSALFAGTGATSTRGDVDLLDADATRGASGPVVMALSGFSKWSLLGPRPSLIKARESGTVLDCQPWSA